MYIEFGIGKWLETKVFLYAFTHQVLCLSIYLSVYLSLYLSIYLSVSLPPSVYLSTCMYLYSVPEQSVWHDKLVHANNLVAFIHSLFSLSLSHIDINIFWVVFLVCISGN